MRKYLTFAAMVLSSGGAMIAAAGVANAATANDGLRAAPWMAGSPMAMHGLPWSGSEQAEGLCGMQRDATRAGTIDTDLVQKLCAGEMSGVSGDMTPPSVPGPPPTGWGHDRDHDHDHGPCPVVCTPPVPPPPPVTTPQPCPPPPCPPVPPPPPVTPPCPPVPPPPPVPCPPPVPNPCPPGDDRGHDHDHAVMAPASDAAPAAATPASGNAAAGLPIVGSALGGLL